MVSVALLLAEGCARMVTIFLDLGEWAAGKAGPEEVEPFAPGATVALVIGASAVLWLIVWGVVALIF